MSDKPIDPEMKGWLYKWTNYLKGYQKRWFVLSNGLLSYYRTQAEMLHTCRGNISLQGAIIQTEDSCNFVIKNGGTQTFHLKASSEVERQKWVTALELAKAKVVHLSDSEDEDDDEEGDSPIDDVAYTVMTLNSKLEDLRTSYDLITKHASNLQKSLTELENYDPSNKDANTKSKTVNERATLFRISSNTMINASSDFLEVSQSTGKKWAKLLQHERGRRIQLEEMVETLATQHSHLEEEAKEQMSHHTIPSSTNTAQSPSEEEDEFEFEDAVDEFSEDIYLPVSKALYQTTIGASTTEEDKDYRNSEEQVKVIMKKDSNSNEENIVFPRDSVDGDDRNKNSLIPKSYVLNGGSQTLHRRRRTRVPDKSNQPVNLWSILKNCIGKELSKIPMPVNFSEPLSFLQRLVEDFEYSDILNKAAQVDDPCEQLAWVAAFTISSYATTTVRTGKPFNPLLGETYEFDRTDDLGWRVISEQVSHHPPIVAQHVESAQWCSWQEFSMSSKFRGKYLQIIPLGIAHLLFHKSGNHYTWRKVSTTVHNMIVGKLWLDNHGEMEIVNHRTKDKCCIKFIPYSYFSRETPKKVTGYVVDSFGNVQWILNGTWDDRIEVSKVTSASIRNGKPVYEKTSPRVLWKRNYVNPESERYYNFTEFACQLNEEEDVVCLTDSRLRPDQRLMENGMWDEANAEKLRLEEKQRAARRHRESQIEQGKDVSPYEPVWFDRDIDPTTNEPIYKYKGGYWESKQKSDWSMCPNIF